MAHRNRAPVEMLVAEGAREAKTPREMAEQCDVIVLCVTGSPEVLSVIGGPDGIASAGRPVTIVDCSTSDPSVTTKLAADLAGSGLTLIDAPLSRTPADAAAGTLDVMVGGSGQTCSACGRYSNVSPVGSSTRGRPAPVTR